MFKKFKAMRALRKQMQDVLVNIQQQEQEYTALSPEEFTALPEAELFDAAQARIYAVVDQYDDPAQALAALSGPARTFYIAAGYEAEVNNGGLCQFFVNSTRVTAPYLSDCLAQIGATAHQQLFDDFVSKNNIDLTKLDSFIVTRASQFEKQAKRYDFDSFDDAFYDLPSIQDLLTAYVKAHTSEF